MIQINMQLNTESGIWIPFSAEDLEQSKNYRNNQICGARITGVQKPRSLEQLALFWCCCRAVSQNTQDSNWDTPEKVAEQVKVSLGFTKGYIVTGKTVHFIMRSISFKELRHMEACNFFTQAWPVMARHIQVPVDLMLTMGREHYSRG